MDDLEYTAITPWRDFIKKSPRRFFSLLQPYLVFHLLSYFDESYCLEIVQHPCPPWATSLPISASIVILAHYDVFSSFVS